MKEKRKEQALRRKNFFPTLILTVLLWAAAGALIYFVEPDTFGAISAFFMTIFFALLFTFSTILANTRRGLITALGLTIFLILRYLGVGNILNFLLIAGVVITAELYFSTR
ncbi:hypothetical protein A2210_02715 [Candidatus Woesebacteria bacterium RIFOXYA1_FULL_40_18]|uniref:Uncharacterized protein n=2 Tax=Candidatus Woeseibacteriota TaxID=1752722 RepID=A0A1F8CLY6_9BACT|nr:MAG: hypothetical protein A2210_02715 [Candidatus Woesebacteria bacterium RIFOXYA1_FULL_40_18]OGM81122.1 MAG: hypothetical protein A2361_01335 [Candidatus Woesebacteria bacterium RIFOXYB1_FULL_40_26]